MQVEEGQKTRTGFEVTHGGRALPVPAILGPLLGLGYIIVMPFAGVAAFVLAMGYRGTESLTTMWRRGTQAGADAGEETRIEAAGLGELLQLFIDRTECEFMVIDREFRITQHWVPIQRHHELVERTAVGQHCFEVSHGRNSPCASRECQCPVRAVLETNGQVAVKHYHEDRTGSKGVQRLVEVVASPVRNGEGNITHVAQLICDTGNV